MVERKRLPDERKALTHKFTIESGDKQLLFDEKGNGKITIKDLDVYVTLGFFEDGTVGEMFLKVGRAGGELHGVYDTLMTITSVALQYGVPLRTIVQKFLHQNFDPAGTIKDKEMIAKSIPDYLGRWLKEKFFPGEQL